MAQNSPRANVQNSRRSIVDKSDEGSQSGKIPRIDETPRGEKANADLNPKFRGVADEYRDYAEKEERDIG